MTGGAIAFMALSWALVLGLAAWSYARILRHKKHFDPDGPGGALPPEPPLIDRQPPRR